MPRTYETCSTLPDDVQPSIEAFYRRIYYEVIDYVVQAIRSRFDQNGYQILSKLEQMLCQFRSISG